MCVCVWKEGCVCVCVCGRRGVCVWKKGCVCTEGGVCGRGVGVCVCVCVCVCVEGGVCVHHESVYVVCM